MQKRKNFLWTEKTERMTASLNADCWMWIVKWNAVLWMAWMRLKPCYVEYWKCEMSLWMNLINTLCISLYDKCGRLRTFRGSALRLNWKLIVRLKVCWSVLKDRSCNWNVDGRDMIANYAIWGQYEGDSRQAKNERRQGMLKERNWWNEENNGERKHQRTQETVNESMNILALLRNGDLYLERFAFVLREWTQPAFSWVLLGKKC